MWWFDQHQRLGPSVRWTDLFRPADNGNTNHHLHNTGDHNRLIDPSEAAVRSAVTSASPTISPSSPASRVVSRTRTFNYYPQQDHSHYIGNYNHYLDTVAQNDAFAAFDSRRTGFVRRQVRTCAEEEQQPAPQLPRLTGTDEGITARVAASVIPHTSKSALQHDQLTGNIGRSPSEATNNATPAPSSPNPCPTWAQRTKSPACAKKAHTTTAGCAVLHDPVRTSDFPAHRHDRFHGRPSESPHHHARNSRRTDAQAIPERRTSRSHVDRSHRSNDILLASSSHHSNTRDDRSTTRRNLRSWEKARHKAQHTHHRKPSSQPEPLLTATEHADGRSTPTHAALLFSTSHSHVLSVEHLQQHLQQHQQQQQQSLRADSHGHQRHEEATPGTGGAIFSTLASSSQLRICDEKKSRHAHCVCAGEVNTHRHGENATRMGRSSTDSLISIMTPATAAAAALPSNYRGSFLIRAEEAAGLSHDACPRRTACEGDAPASPSRSHTHVYPGAGGCDTQGRPGNGGEDAESEGVEHVFSAYSRAGEVTHDPYMSLSTIDAYSQHDNSNNKYSSNNHTTAASCASNDQPRMKCVPAHACNPHTRAPSWAKKVSRRQTLVRVLPWRHTSALCCESGLRHRSSRPSTPNEGPTRRLRAATAEAAGIVSATAEAAGVIGSTSKPAVVKATLLKAEEEAVGLHRLVASEHVGTVRAVVRSPNTQEEQHASTSRPALYDAVRPCCPSVHLATSISHLPVRECMQRNQQHQQGQKQQQQQQQQQQSMREGGYVHDAQRAMNDASVEGYVDDSTDGNSTRQLNMRHHSAAGRSSYWSSTHQRDCTFYSCHHRRGDTSHPNTSVDENNILARTQGALRCRRGHQTRHTDTRSNTTLTTTHALNDGNHSHSNHGSQNHHRRHHCADASNNGNGNRNLNNPSSHPNNSRSSSSISTNCYRRSCDTRSSGTDHTNGGGDSDGNKNGGGTGRYIFPDADRKALQLAGRTYSTRNFNAFHSFSWDRRLFLPAQYGVISGFFRLLASPRFRDKMEWTIRGALMTILPTVVLCLEPRTRGIFPIPSSVVALAFWICLATFGAGLRELYIALKGFTLSVVLLCILIAIHPNSAWLSLLLLFIFVLTVSFIAEETRRVTTFTLVTLMANYIYNPDKTTFRFAVNYFLTLLLALAFGMAPYFVPYINWSSEVARHYLSVMGDAVSLSVCGMCTGFWARSPLERQLHVTRLRQLRDTLTESKVRADTAMSEMGYEPHRGVYTARLRARMALLRRVSTILEAMMLAMEHMAHDPSRIDTPLCNAFGARVLPELNRMAMCMDATLMRIANVRCRVTVAEMQAFRAQVARFSDVVSDIREEIIIHNECYRPDVSDILLGFFLFSTEDLCGAIAAFAEDPHPPNNLTYFLTFPFRDLSSLTSACGALWIALWRRHTITRRLKEAIKLALCIYFAGLFQVYALRNSERSAAAGMDVIALVYNRTGGMSFHYASNRLLGTVLGSLAGLLAVQLASGRRGVLYIFVTLISLAGVYVQAAPDHFPLGNGVCNSVFAVVLQYQDQSAAVTRIQQNSFAILMYFVVTSVVWPVRSRRKMKLGLDVSLRMFREIVHRLFHNLDLPEDAEQVSADALTLIDEMSRRIGVQVTNLPGAVIEPTLESAAFPVMSWRMLIAAQQKLNATLLMMRNAYETFMSSTVGMNYRFDDADVKSPSGACPDGNNTDANTNNNRMSSVSVHWVILHRIAPTMKELSDLVDAAAEIFLLSFPNAAVVPTAHLTTIREGMLRCRRTVYRIYIRTIERDVFGREGSVSDSEDSDGAYDDSCTHSRPYPYHAHQSRTHTKRSKSNACSKGNKHCSTTTTNTTTRRSTTTSGDSRVHSCSHTRHADSADRGCTSSVSAQCRCDSSAAPLFAQHTLSASLPGDISLAASSHPFGHGPSDPAMTHNPAMAYKMRPEEQAMLASFIHCGSITPDRRTSTTMHDDAPYALGHGEFVHRPAATCTPANDAALPIPILPVIARDSANSTLHRGHHLAAAATSRRTNRVRRGKHDHDLKQSHRSCHATVHPRCGHHRRHGSRHRNRHCSIGHSGQSDDCCNTCRHHDTIDADGIRVAAHNPCDANIDADEDDDQTPYFVCDNLLSLTMPGVGAPSPAANNSGNAIHMSDTAVLQQERQTSPIDETCITVPRDRAASPAVIADGLPIQTLHQSVVSCSHKARSCSRCHRSGSSSSSSIVHSHSDSCRLHENDNNRTNSSPSNTNAHSVLIRNNNSHIDTARIQLAEAAQTVDLFTYARATNRARVVNTVGLYRRHWKNGVTDRPTNGVTSSTPNDVPNTDAISPDNNNNNVARSNDCPNNNNANSDNLIGGIGHLISRPNGELDDSLPQPRAHNLGGAGESGALRNAVHPFDPLSKVDSAGGGNTVLNSSLALRNRVAQVVNSNNSCHNMTNCNTNNTTASTTEAANSTNPITAPDTARGAESRTQPECVTSQTPRHVSHSNVALCGCAHPRPAASLSTTHNHSNHHDHHHHHHGLHLRHHHQQHHGHLPHASHSHRCHCHTHPCSRDSSSHSGSDANSYSSTSCTCHEEDGSAQEATDVGGGMGTEQNGVVADRLCVRGLDDAAGTPTYNMAQPVQITPATAVASIPLPLVESAAEPRIATEDEAGAIYVAAPAAEAPEPALLSTTAAGATTAAHGGTHMLSDTAAVDANAVAAEALPDVAAYATAGQTVAERTSSHCALAMRHASHVDAGEESPPHCTAVAISLGGECNSTSVHEPVESVGVPFGHHSSSSPCHALRRRRSGGGAVVRLLSRLRQHFRSRRDRNTLRNNANAMTSVHDPGCNVCTTIDTNADANHTRQQEPALPQCRRLPASSTDILLYPVSGSSDAAALGIDSEAHRQSMSNYRALLQAQMQRRAYGVSVCESDENTKDPAATAVAIPVVHSSLLARPEPSADEACASPMTSAPSVQRFHPTSTPNIGLVPNLTPDGYGTIDTNTDGDNDSRRVSRDVSSGGHGESRLHNSTESIHSSHMSKRTRDGVASAVNSSTSRARRVRSSSRSDGGQSRYRLDESHPGVGHINEQDSIRRTGYYHRVTDATDTGAQNALDDARRRDRMIDAVRGGDEADFAANTPSRANVIDSGEQSALRVESNRSRRTHPRQPYYSLSARAKGEDLVAENIVIPDNVGNNNSSFTTNKINNDDNYNNDTNTNHSMVNADDESTSSNTAEAVSVTLPKRGHVITRRATIPQRTQAQQLRAVQQANQEARLAQGSYYYGTAEPLQAADDELNVGDAHDVIGPVHRHAGKIGAEQLLKEPGRFDAEQGVFILTNRDVHSLEAFLFGISALVDQLDEFQQHLLEMLHNHEMAKKL